jgi:hypothetical protein
MICEYNLAMWPSSAQFGTLHSVDRLPGGIVLTVASETGSNAVYLATQPGSCRSLLPCWLHKSRRVGGMFPGGGKPFPASSVAQSSSHLRDYGLPTIASASGESARTELASPVWVFP